MALAWREGASAIRMASHKIVRVATARKRHRVLLRRGKYASTSATQEQNRGCEKVNVYAMRVLELRYYLGAMT
jgi:hypothetical protein